jgi:RNA polymerase sigma-70 factor (ECF subfamily)
MQEYQPALHRLAAAYVDATADRDDLFQEIATALWQAIPNYRAEASERTWLYRIAHNTAITAASKLRRRGRTESALEAAAQPVAASAAVPADEQMIREERRDIMIRAIRTLEVVDQQIVLLHLEGLSNGEIREISGLSEGAVATRLSRIRDRLAQEIRRKEVGRP